MLKKILSIILVILVVFQGGYAFAEDNQESAATTLPAIQIMDSSGFSAENEVNYITPEGGVDFETAKNLVLEALSDETLAESDLKEITTPEFWENTGAQIYISEGEDRSCITFIKNGNVIGTAGVSHILAVYIADVNSDDKYDVCINDSLGFGLVRFGIVVFDVENFKGYSLFSGFATYSFKIDEDTKKLVVYKNEDMIGNPILSGGELTASEEKNKLMVESVDGNIEISLEGKTVDFTDAQPFVDENSRTQVPVRAVAEMLDCDVEWDGKTQTVTITRTNGDVVKLAIGSNIMQINGEDVYMDTSAIIKYDRTYIPVRFIAEAIGYEVGWI